MIRQINSQIQECAKCKKFFPNNDTINQYSKIKSDFTPTCTGKLCLKYLGGMMKNSCPRRLNMKLRLFLDNFNKCIVIYAPISTFSISYGYQELYSHLSSTEFENFRKENK